MADSNPFMGTIQGMDAGVSWAHQAAGVAMQKQQLDQQMQQHQEMKRQFDVKVGQQMYDQYNDILPMEPGELKNTKLKQFQEQWTNAGYGVNETWLAAAKDKGYSIKLGSVLKKMGALDGDPELVDSIVSQMPGSMQKEFSMKAIEGGMEKALAVKMMRERMDDINHRQDVRIDATAASKAIGQAEGAVKNDMQVFRAFGNLKDLTKAIDDGKIVDTSQLLSKIQTEEQKIMRGSNQLAEGSAERQRADSYRQVLTNWVQKLKNGPVSSNLSAWRTQIEKESDESMKSYMDDVDAQHDRLRNTYKDFPRAVSAIDRSFNTTRETTAKRFGGWRGYKPSDYQPPAEKPAPAPAPEKPAAETKPEVPPEKKSLTADKYRAMIAKYPDRRKRLIEDAQKTLDADEFKKLLQP